MRNILVLTTGGTISSKPDRETGLLKAGSIGGEDLVEKAIFDENISVVVQEVFQFPSNHMDFDLLIRLKEAVESAVADGNYDGVVITHGTDTLEETAYFLHLVINTNKPVVITGSQRSAQDPGSDVEMNLGQAIQVAADKKSKGLGVLVLFNEEIHSPRDVRKIHAGNLAGFSSLGYGTLGVVDKGEVIYHRIPFGRKTYRLKESLAKVDMVTCALGDDGKYIEASIASGAGGIVLDGFGRGHVPPAFMLKIDKGVNQGIVFVITSQALEGRVYPVYTFPGSFHDLTNRGVISGGSLSGRKARIKLAVLISLYGSDRERIAREFQEGL